MPIDYFPANKIIIDVDERLDGPLVIAYCRQDPHFKETFKTVSSRKSETRAVEQ